MRFETTFVDKPWGHELIWAHTDSYVGKVLHIDEGESLSLQYHERKDEAFLVHEGTLELVLGAGEEQRVETLTAGQSRHIPPGTVHRFRAVTDCSLFEVSTPELQDVVRLEDDYGREGTSDEEPSES